MQRTPNGIILAVQAVCDVVNVVILRPFRVHLVHLALLRVFAVWSPWCGRRRSIVAQPRFHARLAQLGGGDVRAGEFDNCCSVLVLDHMPLVSVNRYPSHSAGVCMMRMPNGMTMIVQVMCDAATVSVIRSSWISSVFTMVCVAWSP